MVILLTIGQFLFQYSLEDMWGFINVSQLVFYFPVMGVDLPANALYLFHFLAFFTGDLYLLE